LNSTADCSRCPADGRGRGREIMFDAPQDYETGAFFGLVLAFEAC
jgi:hypothetical protein